MNYFLMNKEQIIAPPILVVVPVACSLGVSPVLVAGRRIALVWLTILAERLLLVRRRLTILASAAAVVRALDVVSALRVGRAC